MRLLRKPLVFVFLCSSCAAFTTSSPPIGEFFDQVLDPLAAKIANERIEQAQAELKSGQISTGLAGLLGLAPPYGPIAGGLIALNNANVDAQATALDARRLPLKNELLKLFESRAKATTDGYAVCVEGVERRYRVQDGKFLRGENGPGPCETVQVVTY